MNRSVWRRRDRRPSSAAFVVMMQPAEARNFDDRAAGRRFHSPRARRVFVEREGRPPPLIIGDVLLQQAPEASGVPDDHVIEVLSPS